MNKTKAILALVIALVVVVSGYYLNYANQQEKEFACPPPTITFVVSEHYYEGVDEEGNHTVPQKLYVWIAETNPTAVWCMLHDCGYYDCGENDPMRHYWSEILDDEFGGDVERIVVEAYTKNSSANTACEVEAIYHYVSFDCVKVVFGVRNETNYNSLLDCFVEEEMKYEEGNE